MKALSFAKEPALFRLRMEEIPLLAGHRCITQSGISTLSVRNPRFLCVYLCAIHWHSVNRISENVARKEDSSGLQAYTPR